MSYAVDPAQLNAFLAAERQQESGGNYTASNPGGASGAYQFEPATWREWATRAGFGQYAAMPAASAPPQVQDAVAAAMASSYYAGSGSWLTTAEDWYYPAGVANPSIVPPGNVLSVGQYGADVVARMKGASSGATPATATSSIAGDLAGPVIGWLDNYAMRAALFVVGAVAILAGLVHLVRQTAPSRPGSARQPSPAPRKGAGKPEAAPGGSEGTTAPDWGAPVEAAA